MNLAVRARRYCLAIIFTLIPTLVGQVALAQLSGSEYQVKAAFLYQFATYVQWPEEAFTNATDPLVFGVIAADELADNLEEIARSRRIGERPISVRRLTPEDTLTGSHVLFLGMNTETIVQEVLSQLTDTTVLTVTEVSGTRLMGSVINFEIIDERVRFDVFVGLAERKGLQISARLLGVAQRVLE